ncbi:Uncharacterized protein dnm_036360 [Desulfonema magnum]|uniref:Uncharacterized protein n=1 Tax=Desulfonema magnum TaxID=45655 RepID=A0A975BLX8_9BACT|nr:Uncharacterized protein dnm_036360 [Desulfonema magnum]
MSRRQKQKSCQSSNQVNQGSGSYNDKIVMCSHTEQEPKQ